MTLWGYLTAAIVALVLLLGVQTYRIDRLHADLAAARGETRAARDALTASEKARDREAKAATASFEGLQTTCTALGAAGIQKGRIIERIVSAPASASGGRGPLVGAGELRGVLGQDAAPAAPGSLRP